MDKGPFYPPRVKKIIDSVTIGPLATEEQNQVRNLITEFADVFALSVREVKPVDFIKFRLNIPKDVEYPTKKEWYYPVLDDFVTAGVLKAIRPDEPKGHMVHRD
ncbi:hypothetical protein EV363DRAFT_1402786 [Boletus edulis]|nr:hypothetical protein EV363DRAFT_1402786 [Boletus edulis]